VYELSTSVNGSRKRNTVTVKTSRFTACFPLGHKQSYRIVYSVRQYKDIRRQKKGRKI
jgi:hypothetical protein